MMSSTAKIQYIPLEQPIQELEEKIQELSSVLDAGDIDITEELASLKKKRDDLIRKLFDSEALSAWDVAQLARHPNRPYTSDYIEHIFTEFDEMEGDRHTAADHSILGGTARLDGQPVMVIGHQKGRSTKEKIKRNFGMPRPEGYRKALRLMKLAEKFKMPIFTFIDTAGAYPGIDAEERNQSEAIARNLLELSKLTVPVICTVVGEGGSGGALAIGVGDRVFMLQYSIYSVISPEGCASILWKNPEKAKDAAEAMQVTAPQIKALGLIDAVIPEPLGGAHRNVALMAKNLKATLVEELAILKNQPIKELLDARYHRILDCGQSVRNED